ncbi:MAG: hypothetical protein JKY28_04240 [Sulfurimonas sp.]|nr:hypothetical protein [Sulfurimonas sp.]PHQ88689.1 MAG: hypothetical protein COB42_08325 [Sulfurimonas sp.]
MHIKRYTIVSFLFITFIGWYITTFISTQTISVNLLGIEIAPLSVSIWAMALLFVFYIASVIHMSFYSIAHTFNMRRYKKDYKTIIDCISDAYLGKENRHHVFKTSKYKLFGSLLDNTSLFPSARVNEHIDDEKIATTIHLIKSIQEGKVVDLKKQGLSIDNPLRVQNERNKYENNLQAAEDFLSNPVKFNKELLDEIYIDFVKTSSLKMIEKYKVFMSKSALFTIVSRISTDESKLEINNETLIRLFNTIKLDTSDYIKMSGLISLGMIPEQRMKLFEILSDSNDEAMDAYLYTLYDLEMIAPADAILEISQGDEYLNFKAYRALKENNQNFSINLFVTDRIC